MMRPHLIVAENSNLPILIIDREGSIGLGLYARLKDHLQVVLVGGREPQENHNLLFLALSERIPSIPSDRYSHIFFIADSEKDISDFLPSCSQKAKEDHAKLLVIISYREVNQHTISEIISSYTDVMILIVREIFGFAFHAKRKNKVEDLFFQAKIKKSIKLSNMGLEKLYPIHYEDVILEILKLGFGQIKEDKVFYLFCRYPVTKLGLAHALQKVNPLIKIDFVEGDKEKESPHIQSGVYLLPEAYPLFDKFYNAYSQYNNKNETEDLNLNFKDKLNSRKLSLGYYMLLFSFFFFITLILLPLLLTILAGYKGEQFLLQTNSQLRSGNFSLARKSAANAGNFFNFAEKTFQVLNLEAGLLGLQERLAIFNEKLEIGSSISLEADRAAAAVETLKNIVSGYSLHPDEDINSVVSNFKQTLISMQQYVQNPILPLNVRQEIGKQLDSISLFANIDEGLPSVLSVSGKKTYAILFQNNTELRPGGGFLGSYALLTLNKGKVVDFSIHDVYDADGQLKGHIEPPFQIRRYLQSAHWYMRDSNFDVDFLKDASQVAFFLQLESGQQIDGVIGVDLSFVKSIVKALGSVTVPEYGETVTPENFFQVTETHAEKNFFPGSTQKKDFLRSLFAAINNKISLGKVSYSELFSQAAISAKEKHLLFAFADKPTQDLFTVNDLSSTLWDARIQADGNVNDFLGINEANLGENKVNYYVTRSVDQRVVINDIGDVSEQITLNYENKSKNQYPGGEYKNYIRIILPKDTSLVKIMIDGQEQTMIPAVEDFRQYEAKNFVPPTGFEVARQDEENKSIYGFLVSIPSGAKKTITIIYVLPQKFNMNMILQNYDLVYFKQPGTDNYLYSFSLAYPSSIKAVNLPPGFLNQGTQVIYSGEITTDLKGDISLSKK